MSNVPNKDHWRDLAELLGLPPDQGQAEPAPSPTSAFQDTEPEEPQADFTATDRDSPEASPFKQQDFASVMHEEVVVPERQVVPDSPDDSVASERTPAESALPLAESEPGAGDETRHDRPRRGRRRGRRGQKDERDRPTRDTEPMMDDSSASLKEPLGQAAPRAEVPETGAEMFREEDVGAGQRGFEEAPAGDFEEHDDVPEMEDRESAEPMRENEDDDDEEIDKLTDWNVPSWTELIGSLYRPER